MFNIAYATITTAAETANMTDSEAAVAIAGIALVAVIAVVAIWQVLATARAKMSVAREAAYREVAEESAKAQTLTAERLAAIAAELGELRTRTGELERLIKTVE
jgi:ABC-type nickel/cobalt efflux system permease component RcnA